MKAHGEKHHNSKVTVQDVLLIRELRNTHGLKLKEIAEKFDIKHPTVANICNLRTWKHVIG